MITTIETKREQLASGFYQRGSGSTEILILGSCRTVAYLSYLVRWNNANGDKFTIRRIDPCDWHWDSSDQPVDINEVIKGLETDERILSVIQETDIFIHEHLESFGMFNTERNSENNIFQHGMMPSMNISIPNWHDKFILENDYGACGIDTPPDYIEKGESEVEKFCGVCLLSSFPEMADYFRTKWREIRFFWRPNHTSAAFTMYVFRRMNSRFLNLTLNEDFINAAAQEDLFKEPHTQVTQRDIDGYQLLWR